MKHVNELILVGTTTEVVSVVRVDGAVIGTGQPGPIARQLHQAYEAAVARWLAGGVADRAVPSASDRLREAE